jgi:hypothetical protein
VTFFAKKFDTPIIDCSPGYSYHPETPWCSSNPNPTDIIADTMSSAVMPDPIACWQHGDHT